jgi:hypothetical protein
MRGAAPSWMVSVLRVGADDASSGNKVKAISPRMMNSLEKEDGLPETIDKEGDVVVIVLILMGTLTVWKLLREVVDGEGRW